MTSAAQTAIATCNDLVARYNADPASVSKADLIAARTVVWRAEDAAETEAERLACRTAGAAVSDALEAAYAAREAATVAPVAARSPDLSAWSLVNVGSRECANAKIGWRPVVLLSVGVHGWDMRVTFDGCLDWTWRGVGGKPEAEAAFGAFWAAHKGTLEALEAAKKRSADAGDALKRTRSVSGRNAALTTLENVAVEIKGLTAAIRAWKP